MASPCAATSEFPPPLLPHHLFFTTIPENEREEEDEADTPEEPEQRDEPQSGPVATPPATTDPYQHKATPLHRTPPSSAATTSKSTPPKEVQPIRDEDDHVVSCNKCRPSAREKISVVPVDSTGGGHGTSRASTPFPSPRNNSTFRSFFSSITWRSPRLSSCSFASASAVPPSLPPAQEEKWRLAAIELSRKLIHATRKRDEALLEASHLKQSMAELEKKLTSLENYCHDLKSSLDHCSHSNPPLSFAAPANPNRDFPVEPFLRAVSEARSAIRHLSRSLVSQIRQAGTPLKAHEHNLQPLQPYDVRLSAGSRYNLRAGHLLYLEALLSRAFFEDFESAGFKRGGSEHVLDPRSRAAANLASYTALRGLSWEDVLSKGTRHYSEGFSRFCDRKMSEVAGTVLGDGGLWGCGGAWPEPLLQAFFGAAKWVWLVHLLAWCDHPPVPVFRVDKGVDFDGDYMEDAVAGRLMRLAPATVRIMVAPGFFVRDSMVKCKVLCTYHLCGSS